MANVFVEARPKGRPEGSAIEGYVVEDHTDNVLGSFKTQEEASPGLNGMIILLSGSRALSERQKEAGSQATGLKRLRAHSPSPRCCRAALRGQTAPRGLNRTIQPGSHLTRPNLWTI